jgi:hypothetical protein
MENIIIDYLLQKKKDNIFLPTKRTIAGVFKHVPCQTFCQATQDKMPNITTRVHYWRWKLKKN